VEELLKQDKFKFIEEGVGEPLVLLHGLFGALSNFQSLIEYFKNYNKVIVPMLPLLDMDMLRNALRHSQGAQRADQHRCAAVRRQYLRSRNRIDLEEKFRCSG